MKKTSERYDTYVNSIDLYVKLALKSSTNGRICISNQLTEIDGLQLFPKKPFIRLAISSNQTIYPNSSKIEIIVGPECNALFTQKAQSSRVDQLLTFQREINILRAQSNIIYPCIKRLVNWRRRIYHASFVVFHSCPCHHYSWKQMKISRPLGKTKRTTNLRILVKTQSKITHCLLQFLLSHALALKFSAGA